MTRPLWTDPDEQTYPSLEGNVSVDVAIVGGGFSGLGAATGLRDSGRSVALLEARAIASGASGRNAGFVLVGSALGYRDSLRVLGGAETSKIWTLTRENQRDLERIVAGCETRCGYLRRGSMSMAASEAEWDEMQVDVQAMAANGIDVCPVERHELPVEYADSYVGGIYWAGNGELDPGCTLRHVAGSLGDATRIYERSRVVGIERQQRWQLSTESGSVKADQVVIATNAYTRELLPSVSIAPTRGQVIATQPIGRTVVPFPMYANRGYQYWRQTSEGRIVLGGWRDLDLDVEVGCEEEENPRIHAALDEFLRDVLGVHASIEYRWAGIMGFTPDYLPLVGAVPGSPGLFMAAGYSGHGVSMAFRCGRLAAGMAIGERVEIPRGFDPQRFLIEA